MNKFQNKYRIPSHRKPGWDYSSNGMYFITLVTQNRECCLGNIHNGEMVFSDFGKIVYNEWVKSFEIRQELFIDQYTIMPNHLHAIIVINHDGANHDRMNHDGMNENGMNDSGGGNDGGGTNENGTNENGTNNGGGNDYGGTNNGGGTNDRGTNKNGTNDGGGNDYGGTNNGGGTNDRGTRDRRDARPCVSTTTSTTSTTSTTPITPTPGCIRLPKSLSSFIGGFKSSVNTQIDNYIDEHHLKITKYNKNNHFFQPNYHDHIIRDEEEYHRIKNYIIQNPLKWDDDSLKINHSVS